MEDTATTPLVVDLHDPRSTDPALAGAKAANLARAVAAGMPVLAGFVVTTAATSGGVTTRARVAARAAWGEVGGPAVVRSSSTVEDAGASSMAGQFTTVLGVDDVRAFDDALDRVIGSGLRPKSGPGGLPMAVLVQREVQPVAGGVAFGLDPVTGDRKVCAIDAVRGSPDSVVSGRAVAAHVVLSRRGRVRSWVGPRLDDVLPLERLRAVARLARQAERVFGAPQDIEWAIDGDGALWLLQSRPVTAASTTRGRGPIYGPGPLVETFPDALAALEVELWVDPLREAIAAALGVIGVVPARRVRESEVVVVIGGRAAIDLELIGATPRPRFGLTRLAPSRGARRLVAAWRTGRLRAALPLLARDLLGAVDRELMNVPALESLDERQLLEVLESTATDLRALHGYEVLCGMLLRGEDVTAAGIALRAVARGRRSGMSDEEIVAAEPVALALVGPRIGGAHELPDVAVSTSSATVADLGPREALRLRCRWMQELGARAAIELAARLEHAGILRDASRARELSLASFAAMVEGTPVRLPDTPFTSGPPLPAVFRLDDARSPVDQRARGSGAGVAASAGRAMGHVRHATTPRTNGRRDVLIVDALAPELAAELAHVAAIVSESGSPLSHLAILARELALPVAVGVEDALARFPEGTLVLVDGGTGTVSAIDEAVAS